jgi:hypothetical protein
MDREFQQLSRDVHDLWREEVARATAADLRHRPRDKVVRVQVVQPFRVSGRECAPGETVAVEAWLVSGLVATGHATKL